MAEVAHVSTVGHRKARAAKQRGVAQLIERVVMFSLTLIRILCFNSFIWGDLWHAS